MVLCRIWVGKAAACLFDGVDGDGQESLFIDVVEGTAESAEAEAEVELCVGEVEA